jgi:uncharacterized protein (DUF2249 family)
MSNDTKTSFTEEVFDGRELPCETKRPGFLSRCVELPIGRSFVFLNGHDPVPLRGQLDRQYPGCFRWEIAETEVADAIRLRVTKVAAPSKGFASETSTASCS